MSKVRMLKVEITQNSLLKTVADVPQWEAQVLLAVWGEDAQVVAEYFEDREIPEANDEFARLAFKYGPKDDDNPFVARVYGNFGPGINALEREFIASMPAEAQPTVAAPEVESVTEEPEIPVDVALTNAGRALNVKEPEDSEEFDASALLPPGTTIDDLPAAEDSESAGITASEIAALTGEGGDDPLVA